MSKEKKIENPLIQARLPFELDDKLTRVSEMFGLPKNDIARFAIAQFCGSLLGSMDRVTGSVEKMGASMGEILDKAIKEREGVESSGKSEIPELGTFFQAGRK
jgi:hypothetical protein